MGFNYIVAVVQPAVVATLEAKPSSLGVDGITLTKVRGFGEFKCFRALDWLSEHLKAGVYVEASMRNALLDTLREIADADGPGARVLAAMPVDRFLQLRTDADARSRRTCVSATRRQRLPATACRAIAARSSLSRPGGNSAQVPRQPQ